MGQAPLSGNKPLRTGDVLPKKRELETIIDRFGKNVRVRRPREPLLTTRFTVGHWLFPLNFSRFSPFWAEREAPQGLYPRGEREAENGGFLSFCSFYAPFSPVLSRKALLRALGPPPVNHPFHCWSFLFLLPNPGLSPVSLLGQRVGAGP